jgi:hypothetical protein
MVILQFFFGNFWHFVGLLIVLALLGEFVLKLVAILRGYSISDSETIVDDSGKIDYVDNVDNGDKE